MLTGEWSDWRNGGGGGSRACTSNRCIVAAACSPRSTATSKHSRAIRAGVVGLRLYVESDNVPAQRTYAALGMDDAGYRVFEQLLL